MFKTPAERFDLTGKVAVVTGGSRGIGKAVVEGLAAAGADVAIASRKLEACEQLAAEVRSATGRDALAVACHVGHWDDCDRLAAAVYDHYGRCDVLVNNAGMSPLYPDLLSVTEEYYQKVHAVNAQGHGGSIINVTTAGSLRPGTHELPYTMAKAGLNALTLALAGAWSPKVRANLVIPGAYDTDIAKAWAPGSKERIADMNPLARIGEPEDMVGVCLFLASDASSYVNGAQILVDGGAYRAL